MLPPRSTPYQRILAAALLLVAIAAGLLPFSAHAGTSGASATTLAAISFNLQIQGVANGTNLDLTASGTANTTGELEATITTTQPQQHTLYVISVAGILYESEDGAPYQIANGPSGSLGGASSPVAVALTPGQPSSEALSPACVEAETGISSIFKLLVAGQAPAAALGIQDVGAATIDGAAVEHLQSSLNLGSALRNPLIQQQATQLLTACSADGAQIAPLLPLLLSSSTLDVDAYVDQPTGVPRELSLTLDIPFAGVNVSLSGQLTPLSTPVPVTAPS